ncbi:hypothetical protein C8J57DRAFT_1532094 [Mycena rebaudengoi]|nr:hypothetical protein C8J57DRAFT_1532094 [Mycena rebaudengoi]
MLLSWVSPLDKSCLLLPHSSPAASTLFFLNSTIIIFVFLETFTQDIAVLIPVATLVWVPTLGGYALILDQNMLKCRHLTQPWGNPSLSVGNTLLRKRRTGMHPIPFTNPVKWRGKAKDIVVEHVVPDGEDDTEDIVDNKDLEDLLILEIWRTAPCMWTPHVGHVSWGNFVDAQ